MTPNHDMIPSEDIIKAFRAQGQPELLEGGQGTTYRVGDIALQPGEFVSEEAEWIAQVYETIIQEGFRVPKPVRAVDGKIVYDGWSAWEYVNAGHARGRWAEIFATFDAFHKALQDIKRPQFLDTIRNRWINADRKVWGDTPMEYHDRLSASVEKLLSVKKPIDLPSQVIHGDFGGNVLFAKDDGAPYVIDFSPYFRPVGFAKAVIVVDAMVWEGADENILRYLSDEPEYDQLLVRAVLRRILELDGLLTIDGIDRLAEVDAYEKLIRII